MTEEDQLVTPEFAAQTVLTPDAEVVSMASLWADGPVVLVFLRQFG